jgi:hypothetical protein
MTMLIRVALFVPIVFLLMVVFATPQCRTPNEVITAATRKSVRVFVWTAAIVVVLELLQWVVLP